MDLIIKINTGTDTSTKLLEIKCFNETKKPIFKKQKTKNYNKSLATYITNISKWQAAQKYAEKNGWTFEVVTEKFFKR